MSALAIISQTDSIISHLGKWTQIVDLHDALPVHATAYKGQLSYGGKKVFLCYEKSTVVELVILRSGIEEVEWTIKDKQDPTKGSTCCMVGHGWRLATCYKLVW